MIKSLVCLCAFYNGPPSCYRLTEATCLYVELAAGTCANPSTSALTQPLAVQSDGNGTIQICPNCTACDSRLLAANTECAPFSGNLHASTGTYAKGMCDAGGSGALMPAGWLVYAFVCAVAVPVVAHHIYAA